MVTLLLEKLKRDLDKVRKTETQSQVAGGRKVQ
jgi:hypothetical protein